MGAILQMLGFQGVHNSIDDLEELRSKSRQAMDGMLDAEQRLQASIICGPGLLTTNDERSVFIHGETAEVNTLPDACVGAALWYEGGVSVMRVNMHKGQTCPLHSHLEREILVVASGEIEISSGKDVRLLKAGDSISILPNVEHQAQIKKDSSVIAIATPASKEFPRVLNVLFHEHNDIAQ